MTDKNLTATEIQLQNEAYKENVIKPKLMEMTNEMVRPLIERIHNRLMFMETDYYKWGQRKISRNI